MLYLIILGIVICITFSAFFSASEMSLSSANHMRLENEAKNGSKKANRALQLIDDFDDTLGTILIGNNLVNIAASSLSSVLVILIAGNDKYTWIATIGITILVIIFGETIPKITAKQNATRLSLEISTFVRALSIILKPIVFVVVWLVNLLTRGIQTSDDAEDEDESVEELTNIIETAEDEGIIDQDQSELLINALDFGDISAFEVMTARVDIDAVDIDDDISEILQTVKNTTYTRLPVYEDSIDNIIGILHLNDFLIELANDSNMTNQKLRYLLMEPVYVYKTIKMPDVLKILREKMQHMAVVTDEFSGTAGIITMEDVLETIVGEIWDENDTVEEVVIEKNENEYELDGDLAIADFLELTNINEDDYDYDSQTVGGLVMEILERYPETGDIAEYEDMTLKVIEAKERRVEKVLLTINRTEIIEE